MRAIPRSPAGSSIGRRGLTAGASFWRGGSGFGLIRLDIETPTVAVSSLDARYRRGRHELRGQWSMVNIGGAGDLNRALQIAVGQQSQHREPPARRLRRKRPRACRPTPGAHEVVAFGRYEMFDTQNKMPDGLPAARGVSALGAGSAGATYYPDPDVAFKFDVVRERNKSSVVNAPWQLNFGVGWWF